MFVKGTCITWMALLLNVFMPVSSRSIARPKPVLLIPGNGGSQLEGMVDDVWGESNCAKPNEWFRLWLNVYELTPYTLQCWSPMMEMVYDPVRSTSHNKAGIYTRIPGFGQTESIEYIDTSWAAYWLGNAGAYFAPMVQELTNWGYIKGKNLRGAPYDFRLAPHSQRDYFRKLKGLIETMYMENDNTKVVLIAHSAGGLLTQYFLNQQQQSWKNRYVSSFISLGTPWGGSSIVLHAMASGFNWGIKPLTPTVIRQQQRTSETNMLLLARPSKSNAEKPFLFTTKKNYTLANLDDYFDDIGFPEGKQLVKNVRTSDYDLNHPGVDMYCWYSVGVDTPEVFIYSQGQFPDGQPDKFIYTDGDGTVTQASLNKCKELASYNNQVDIKQYYGPDHRALLFEKTLFDDIKQIVY